MRHVGFTTLDPPDTEALNQCIRCGMCLPHCPTYAVLGIEQDSPRGRLSLMRAVHDGRLDVTDPDFHTHMYQCLACLACETACPAGVRFGYLMETTRGQIEQRARRSPPTRLVRWLVFSVLFPHPARLDLVGALLRFYQRSGLQWLARRSGVLRLLGLARQEALLPPLSRRFHHADRREQRPSTAPRARVAFFAGCVQRLFFAEVNRATERVLLRNGCAVAAPEGQTCCGALHAHAGEREGAKALARRNLDRFAVDDVDAIVVNAAGCGAMLKEYGELLHDDPDYAARAVAFSAKVRDIHELLAELPLDPPRSQQSAAPLRVTYQDACHLLHGQRLKAPPRVVLQSIPGVELVEMAQADWCCGSAGIYNVTQPDLSSAVLQGKMDNVAATEASVLAAPNTGCILQLRAGVKARGLKMRVAHPIELLDEAYRRE